MKKKPIYITKASGDTVRFSREKLLRSLTRAGADQVLAKRIADSVAGQIRSGMTTQDVYAKAFSLLRNAERPLAARYGLKQAIMDFGPTGYPFEQFVGALLRERGFDVVVGKVLQGKCVTHEVDVLAEKGRRQIMIETKFHNHRGYHTDVKVPLYIHSRFQDIAAADKKNANEEQWIVTNTKFTSDAIAYGECVGLTLIGWRYPAEGGLEKLIEEIGLHPVTCLTTLTKKDKEALLAKNLVLCKHLIEHEQKLKRMGFSKEKIAKVRQEIEGLCGR